MGLLLSQTTVRRGASTCLVESTSGREAKWQWMLRVMRTEQTYNWRPERRRKEKGQRSRST